MSASDAKRTWVSGFTHQRDVCFQAVGAHRCDGDKLSNRLRMPSIRPSNLQRAKGVGSRRNTPPYNIRFYHSAYRRVAWE